MGIEMKLISADKAYNDKEGSLLDDTGVHLNTPVSSETPFLNMLSLGPSCEL
ncbi:hypothetical protein GMJAKD_03280 [Candidatus Electrothrix aarhusensis]